MTDEQLQEWEDLANASRPRWSLLRVGIWNLVRELREARADLHRTQAEAERLREALARIENVASVSLQVGFQSDALEDIARTARKALGEGTHAD